MHVVEVSERSAFVRIEDGCLAVTADGGTVGKIPLAEIGVVLLSAPHAACSVTALASLASHGVAVIFCDPSMRPAGMMLPFREQHDIGRRIAAQATASVPLRRRVWKSLVRSKIAGQAAVLEQATGVDANLRRLIRRVRSGDPDNVEARAARRYWRRLLGDSFRRRRGDGIANKMLDYGYAVLRASVARALCVAGLHPSLGVHHHHRSNAFALADDLIEPYRPVVDRIVAASVSDYSNETHLNPQIKRQLAACIEGSVPVGSEVRSTQDAIGRSASSLAGVLLGERKDLLLPWMG